MAEQKNPVGGPKSADTKASDIGHDKESDASLTAGADQYLQDARGSVFGDNTSSSGGANNPGQHGRDGGTVDGKPSNPAPKAANDNEKEA